jgi:hypothetical protein
LAARLGARRVRSTYHLPPSTLFSVEVSGVDDDRYDQVELRIEATSTLLSENDERWLDDVDGLSQALEDRLGKGAVRKERRPEPGTRGSVDSLILALGSAGAFTTAAEVIRAWLGRAHDHVVEATVNRTDHEQTVRLRATSVTDGSFEAMFEALVLSSDKSGGEDS